MTHGISFLPKVDQIVVLVDGKISELGSYQELLDHNGAFADFLRNYLTQEEEVESEIDAEGECCGVFVSQFLISDMIVLQLIYKKYTDRF